jgi:hypothetical protein
MLLNDFASKQPEMIRDMGGIDPRLYEIHCKMLILNDVCEKFLAFDGE